ncbi:MAG: hypothetical protein KBC64_04555 [Simkaniaceae bacterium]|nr:hypothetical protein [Simkaniaceae bacterium]
MVIVINKIFDLINPFSENFYYIPPEVLQVFGREVPPYLDPLLADIDSEELKIFITLKYMSEVKVPPHRHPPLSLFVKRQEELQKLVERFRQGMSLSKEDILLFEAMALHDPIKMFLSGDISWEGAFDWISEGAHHAKMCPATFFNLMVAADQATHGTEYDAETAARLEILRTPILRIKEGRSLFVKVKVLTQEEAAAGALPLFLFLRHEHKGLAMMSPEEAKQLPNYTRFRRVKKGFKTLVHHILLENKPLQEQYRSLIQDHSLGAKRLKDLFVPDATIETMYDPCVRTSQEKISLDLYDAIQQFRKTYHLKCALKSIFPSHYYALLMHGTSADFLPYIVNTGNQLVHTGLLTKYETPTLTGEIAQGGNGIYGVNRFAISTVSPEHFERAHRYTTPCIPSTERLIELISEFIHDPQFLFAPNPSAEDPLAGGNIPIIRRLKGLPSLAPLLTRLNTVNPKYFSQIKSDIDKAIDRVRTWINYYQKSFKNEQALFFLNQVEQELLKLEAITPNFAKKRTMDQSCKDVRVIFASTTVLPWLLTARNNPVDDTERLACHPLVLGKDIQVALVEQQVQNTRRVERLLKKLGVTCLPMGKCKEEITSHEAEWHTKWKRIAPI